MSNEELINALRWCGSIDEQHEMCVDESYSCPMWNEDRMTDYCKAELMTVAADSLEAAEKRIAGLEAQLPTIDADQKRIEYLQKLVDMNTERCEGLRKQLREAHENYEKHIEELEEPIEKQIVDYCHKRCLVIVSKELFQRMESTFSQIPKHGEWIVDDEFIDCSVCRCEKWSRMPFESLVKRFRYCPKCGAKMDGEVKQHED